MTPQKTYRWTRVQYLAFHKRMAAKMIQVTQQKNADYTGATNDPFANFRENHEFDSATKMNNAVELGFLTRMNDKWSRIKSIIITGKTNVRSETLTDTLIDFANYLVLVAGYLEERRMAKYLTAGRKMMPTAKRRAPAKKLSTTVDKSVDKHGNLTDEAIEDLNDLQAAGKLKGKKVKKGTKVSMGRRVATVVPETQVTQ